MGRKKGFICACLTLLLLTMPLFGACTKEVPMDVSQEEYNKLVAELEATKAKLTECEKATTASKSRTESEEEEEGVAAPLSRITFFSGQGEHCEISVMDADGSNLQRLTDNLAEVDALPCWSP